MGIILKNKLLTIYYIVLLCLLTPLFGVGDPPMAFRLVYCVAAIIPITFYNVKLFPVVMMVLFTIAKFGIGTPFIPTELYYYTFVFFIVYCISKSKKPAIPLPHSIIWLSALVLIVDFVTSMKISMYGFSLLTVLVFARYIQKSEMPNFSLFFSYLFIIVSVVISFEFLFTDRSYTIMLDTSEERVMWVDPNYLGGVIGMGCLVAFNLLMQNFSKFFLRLVFAGVVAVSFIVLLYNGSRGALLSVAISILYLFCVSDQKIIYKVLLAMVLATFLVFLYNNDYFEIIEMRMENESGGGSGRLTIWENKLSAFNNEINPLRWIFGNGYEGGYALGYINYNGGAGRGFHNDYLAHLCDYGIVGLCLFLSVMISPLKSVGFKCKMANASILFLCVNCFTIEPMTLGMVIYFIFWLYAVSLADDYKKKSYGIC